MNTFGIFILILAISYLLGSIPWGVIISKKFFGFDIRTKGSGNMGSTNVFRILGVKWGIVVQLLDILKGVAAVFIAAELGRSITFPNVINVFQDITIIKFIAGFTAVLGHIFTVFANFKGGKGINTALGMLLAIAPIEVAIAVGVFLIILFLSGYVSLGSILAGIAVPSTLFVRYNIFGINIQGYHFLIYAFIILSMVVIYTHRANIKRLLEGREHHFAKLQLIKIKFFQPRV
jgi:glycerol-3-phosphate acyltransferase PlsY